MKKIEELDSKKRRKERERIMREIRRHTEREKGIDYNNG